MTPFQQKIMAFGLFVPGGFLLCTFMFLTFVVQRRYIVKRYEVETDFAEREKLLEIGRPWIMMFPFLKVVFYSTNLFMVMLMSETTRQKNPYFKDSPSRAEILSHFSRKELVLTAVTAGCAFLGLAIAFVFLILERLWNH